MINVLGENYYIDLDVIEQYLDMSNDTSPEDLSGTTEMKINIIKFEMVKMLLDTGAYLNACNASTYDRMTIKPKLTNSAIRFRN